MSKMFNFRPADYTEKFSENGYVCIPRGLTDDFFKQLSRQVDEYVEKNRLKEWAIGNKQQSLYEFPASSDYYNQLLEAVGTVCSLDHRRLNLSERHIKVYEPNADPNPLAHKDRYASQISVGFSVSVPKGSRLVLYPKDELWVNTYNTWARLRASLTDQNHPEKTLENARRVVIEDQPGDVVMFRGNAIWHLRENAANTTNVYLKLNDFNCDPLGEDPRADVVRESTLAAINRSDEDLKSLVPALGRRVDYVHRQLSRHWDELKEVVFWGDRTVPLQDSEFALLQHLNWNSSVGTVLQKMNFGGNGSGLRVIRRLAALGVLDLFEQHAA